MPKNLSTWIVLQLDIAIVIATAFIVAQLFGNKLMNGFDPLYSSAITFQMVIIWLAGLATGGLLFQRKNMPRASYIYLIHPKGSNDPILATFTVKYEAHNWVRRSEQHTFNTVELTRMKDGGDSTFISSRVLVPWELTDADKETSSEAYDSPKVDCGRTSRLRG